MFEMFSSLYFRTLKFLGVPVRKRGKRKGEGEKDKVKEESRGGRNESDLVQDNGVSITVFCTVASTMM